MAASGARAPRLAIATHNAHKVGEITAILAPLVPGLVDGDLASAGELGAPSPVEDGVTFAQNALIKARALAASSGLPAIADDSGIAVDVMGGAPGIFSALWSGRHGADRENVELLLAQMADIPLEHRGAQFVCAAVLVTPDGREEVCEGVLRGTLALAPAGGGGFGYDPIFIPEGESVTTAELDPARKNEISHRGRAFRALAPHVAAVLRG
jgi:XTP/dITP diphosphohydrolase